jgi:hypothetical protein
MVNNGIPMGIPTPQYSFFKSWNAGLSSIGQSGTGIKISADAGTNPVSE